MSHRIALVAVLALAACSSDASSSSQQPGTVPGDPIAACDEEVLDRCEPVACEADCDDYSLVTVCAVDADCFDVHVDQACLEVAIQGALAGCEQL